MDPNKNKEFVLKRKIYFDKWEKDYGDGFYPQLSYIGGSYNGRRTFDSTILTFKWTSVYPDLWSQVSGSAISGLDGDYGLELLVSLNQESGISASRISNWGGRIVYPTNMNTTYKLMHTITNPSHHTNTSHTNPSHHTNPPYTNPSHTNP